MAKDLDGEVTWLVAVEAALIVFAFAVFVADVE